ncbi:MAG: 3-oxoacyl-ACP reductase FabG [Caldilineaceae bacterium]|nr:3-oxoacyl-ACP reductase FabG [Caldilineaceae bacterium]
MNTALVRSLRSGASRITLPNQVALITGAGRGLGEALARRLAAAGARVALADVQGEAVTRIAGNIAQAEKRPTLALTADVTDDEQVAAMVRRTVAEWGRLDILVANAGIVRSAPLTELGAADFRLVIDVNLTGYFLCAKHAVPVMKEQGRGCIIQINSVSGRRGSPGNSAYVAGKRGGIGFTQSLALELAGYGIRVNGIAPGHLLDSPLWVDSLFAQYAARDQVSPAEIRRRYEARAPLGRACTYDDVAHAVLFLASDQAAYLTGQTLDVSGGEVM